MNAAESRAMLTQVITTESRAVYDAVLLEIGRAPDSRTAEMLQSLEQKYFGMLASMPDAAVIPLAEAETNVRQSWRETFRGALREAAAKLPAS